MKVKVFSASRKKLLRLWMSRSHFLPETFCEIQKSEPLLHHELGFFWKKLPCASSFKTFQPNFFGRWRLSRFQLSQFNGFFLEFPMLNSLIGWWCKPDRSALSPAESPQSWHLEFSSLGTWFLWRGSWKLDWSSILWPVFLKTLIPYGSLKTTDFT